MSGIQKMFKKSEVWSSHGKHAKIDPYFLNPPKPERPQVRWYNSIAELFRAERRRK